MLAPAVLHSLPSFSTSMPHHGLGRMGRNSKNQAVMNRHSNRRQGANLCSVNEPAGNIAAVLTAREAEIVKGRNGTDLDRGTEIFFNTEKIRYPKTFYL